MIIPGKTTKEGVWRLRNLKWLKTEKRTPGRGPTGGRRKPGFIAHHVPPPRRLFLGRDELLQDTIGRLNSGGSVALSAEGLPGVGKTALAIAVAHAPEVRERFEGVLWAGLGREPDVMGILAGWAEALGRDVSRLGTEAERAQAVTDAIGQRRMLLVIDDAWDLDAAWRLRCGGAKCCHLLTTRDKAIARQFALGTGVTAVPVLEPERAYVLLAALAPGACAADPERARGLAEAVGGLPLALELLGGYLAAPERSYFSELSRGALDELADPNLRLKLAQNRLGAALAGKLTLQAMIELSLEDLPEEVAGAFYRLGAFAPRPEQFDQAAALAVAGSDLKGLALLISRNLVAREGERLSIHPALSDTARARMPAEAEERHREHYLSLVNESRGDWRRIEGCYGQIKRAWMTAPADETLLAFVWALRVFQERRGLWGDYLAWAGRALGLAQEKGWRRDIGMLLNNMGWVSNALGQREKALEYYRQALPIREEVGDRAGLAATLNNMGGVYHALGQREKALEYYGQALPIREEVGDRAGLAATLNNMGTVYAALGQRERALEHYWQALAIVEEVGDRPGRAATLNNMGMVYDALGQREKALEYYGQALAIVEEVGDRAGLAATFNNIGLVYDALGQRQKALECYGLVLPIREEMGDRAGRAATLNNMGMVYHALGQLEKALEYYGQARPIVEEVGDRAGLATTLNNIGMVYDALGQREKALEYFGQARPIMEEVGDRAGLATTLNNIGAVYDALGQREKALEYYGQARPIREEVGDRYGESITRYNLATLYRDLGRLTEAVAELKKVVELDELVQQPDLEANRAMLAQVDEELARLGGSPR